MTLMMYISWTVTSTEDQYAKLDFQFQPGKTPSIAEFIDKGMMLWTLSLLK